jgi:hypothetical protein
MLNGMFGGGLTIKRIIACILVICALFCEGCVKSEKQEYAFSYKEDGSVDLSEGYIALGLRQNGRVIDNGSTLQVQGNKLSFGVNFQQNESQKVEYGLIVLLDYRQEYYSVDDERTNFYRFCLEGKDDKNIEVTIDLTEQYANKLSYLIIPEPGLCDFSLDKENGVKELLRSMDVFGGYALIEQEKGKVQPIEGVELEASSLDGEISGFGILDENNGDNLLITVHPNEQRTVHITPWDEDGHDYVLLYFCDWEQLSLDGNEPYRMYKNLRGDNYAYFDTITIPDKTGVGQMLLLREDGLVLSIERTPRFDVR